MRLRIVGKVHPFNQPGLGFGSVVDVEDEVLAREYLGTGWVVVAEPDEERAVVELEVETAVPKRPVGRPRKIPAWHDDDAPGFKPVERQ